MGGDADLDHGQRLLRSMSRQTSFGGTSGQIFKIKHRDQVVRLVKSIWAPLGQSGYWWEVEDVTLGYSFKCSTRAFGRELTDMEAIAWASKI